MPDLSRWLFAGMLAVAGAVSAVACASFGGGTEGVADAATSNDAPPPDATTGTDAKPSGSGACASTAPSFAEDFSAFDGGGWKAVSQNCSPTNTRFVEGSAPSQGLCAELMCVSTAFEAYTTLQTTQPLAENAHVEAELLVSLDPASPEHAFAQGIGWLSKESNLRFFTGSDGVSVHIGNGPPLATWSLNAPGFYLLEVQLTRSNDADGGIATGRFRVAFGGDARLFDLPITVSGASQRAPYLQIGPYFPQTFDAGATDRYDSIKLWSCP